MAYLSNTSFSADDAYTVSGSFWLRPPLGGWSSSILDSEQSDTYQGEPWINNAFYLSCGQYGNTMSFSAGCERTPEDSPVYYDTSIYDVSVLAAAKATDYTTGMLAADLSIPGHGGFVSCPSLVGDVHQGSIPPYPVIDSISANGSVGHVEGHDDNGSWSQDIDFSSLTYKVGTNVWPFPGGSNIITNSVTSVVAGAAGWTVYVQGLGQGIDITTTYKSRSYQGSGTDVLNGEWRHIIFAINNNTKTQSWRVNGVTRSSSITENSTYPNNPWTIKFSGIELCLPTKYTHPLFRMADFQLWTNKYIDPANAANFSKFVRISEGKGYPVDPSWAANAFGQQTMLFRGKASDASFWINRGSGGTFTKTGTITDFTPTPSYG